MYSVGMDEMCYIDSVPITTEDLKRLDENHRRYLVSVAEARMAGSGACCSGSAAADGPSVLVVHDGETVRLEPRHYQTVKLLGSGVAVMVPGTTIHTVESYGTGGIAQDPPMPLTTMPTR